MNSLPSHAQVRIAIPNPARASRNPIKTSCCSSSNRNREGIVRCEGLLSGISEIFIFQAQTEGIYASKGFIGRESLRTGKWANLHDVMTQPGHSINSITNF